VVWKVRAIRGATTASNNSVEAIEESVKELLDEIESRNDLDPEEVVSVIFTTTCDLDAVFLRRSPDNALNGKMSLC
jgi:chorismate mutase